MDKKQKADQVTSKDIISQTGISRATLNNYIKLGILPKPIVKKGGPDLKGIKQIGFFAKDAIDRVLEVKRFKKEGMSIQDIATHFSSKKSSDSIPQLDAKKESSSRKEGQSTLSKLPSMEDIASKFKDISKDSQKVSGSSPRQSARTSDSSSGRRQEDNDLTLSIGDLGTPAFLINHNFEIEWVNKEAEDQIFNRNISSLVDIEARNIFRLFFSWEFHVHIRNWEEAIASHMAIFKHKIDKKNIANLYNGITNKEITFLEKIYDVESTQHEQPIYNSPVGFITQEGEHISYQIYTMSFREGVFCVYIPSEQANQELMQILSNRGKVINELLNQRMPSLISLCVLVADIQDSVRICGELLPEEYFELVNELWKTVGGTFEKYNGIYGKHAGDGMLYYFLKRPGTSYIMDAIECGLEMREKVREFSCNWKLRKNWFNDIYLNTAINEGQEFFGAIHSSTNVEFTALGDSINYTGRLSDFARYGSIWTTKNVISKLTQEERDLIRFGVHRSQSADHDVFLENSFSRIIDLMEESGQTYSQFMDIATLPITEIIEKVN